MFEGCLIVPLFDSIGFTRFLCCVRKLEATSRTKELTRAQYEYRAKMSSSPYNQVGRVQAPYPRRARGQANQ